MGPGAVIAGRYEVVRQIARGGMADIWEAEDLQGGGRLALKILREELSDDAEVLARFQREARAAGALKSKNVARILAWGVTEERRPFIAMELLEGNDLARELDLRGVLPVREAAGYIADACVAMIEAHDAGIIHRDLKPSNLFLATEGGKRVLKVLDFGISKITHQVNENITLTQALFGSPLYMSPEQFRSAKAADIRSDVWSLGVIFYEALTGLPPFVAENAPAVGLAVTKEPHVPPTHRRATLPAGVDAIVDGALKKDPAERYQSMRELLRAIDDLIPGAHDDTPTRLNLTTLGASPSGAAAAADRKPSDPPTRVESSDDDPPTHVDAVADPPTKIDPSQTETHRLPSNSSARPHGSTTAVMPSVHPPPPPPATHSSAPLAADGTRPRDPSGGGDARLFALDDTRTHDMASSTSPLSVAPAPPMRRTSPFVWLLVLGAVGVAAVAWMIVAEPSGPHTAGPTAHPAFAPPTPEATSPAEAIDAATIATGAATEAPPSAAPRVSSSLPAPTDVDDLPAASTSARRPTGAKPPPKKKPAPYVPKGI